MNTNMYIEDISIASFLLAKGCRILEVVETSLHHCTFVFEDIEKCKSLRSEYFNNAEAPARELFMRREELMAEIRNRNRNGDIYGSR